MSARATEATHDGKLEGIAAYPYAVAVMTGKKPRKKPAETRIAIGGRYLDEVRIRLAKPDGYTSISLLSFPASRHRAQADKDCVTVFAQAPTLVQLYADGVLPPIGGRPVPIEVGGVDLGRWTLASVESGGMTGVDDIIVLHFRRASEETRE